MENLKISINIPTFSIQTIKFIIEQQYPHVIKTNEEEISNIYDILNNYDTDAGYDILSTYRSIIFYHKYTPFMILNTIPSIFNGRYSKQGLIADISLDNYKEGKKIERELKIKTIITYVVIGLSILFSGVGLFYWLKK